MLPEGDNTWYAAQITKVVVPPKKMLEAFGTTKVKYSLVSEFPDNPYKTRLREGFIYSIEPSIIAADNISPQKFEGFGDRAMEYANILVHTNQMDQVLKYGLNFKKEEVQEEVYDLPLPLLIDKIETEIRDDEQLRTVIVGDDQLWEVSLLRFMVEYVQNSIPAHLQEFHADPKTGAVLNPGGALQDEIETDFLHSQGNREFIYKLGAKLHEHNLFAQYQDRFFSLLRSL